MGIYAPEATASGNINLLTVITGDEEKKGAIMGILTYEKYKGAWKERKEREETELEARSTQLIEKIRVCADEIRKLGGKRIILFGSLAAGRFRKGSDVDIAVEGLSVKGYFEALGILEDILGDVPFDLVDMREALPSVREKIKKEGIVFV